MTAAREADALGFYPFEGDRDVNPIRLGDGFVNGRKEYVCHICDGPIAKGERHRALIERCEGVAATYRFCALCCAAMADRWLYECGPDPLDRRYTLGMERRRELPSEHSDEDGPAQDEPKEGE